MRNSKIKAKLRQNQPVLLTTLHLADPALFELTSLLGFDGIWLDLEHRSCSVQQAGEFARAARVGSSDIMMRPAKGEFMRMGRLLELGAQGIMYPRCDNADEARQVVRWSKFAPQGERGIDSGNADNPYCLMPLVDYLRAANDETFVVIQIEDPRALAHADEIAAVEGVDILFLGPGDFSVLAGVPGQMDHPKIKDAMQRIASAAKKAGKHWGMPIFSTEHAQQVIEMGGRFLCHGCDLLMVKTGLEEMQRQIFPAGRDLRAARVNPAVLRSGGFCREQYQTADCLGVPCFLDRFQSGGRRAWHDAVGAGFGGRARICPEAVRSDFLALGLQL